MINKKRIISGALAGALALTMTGCSPKESNNDKNKKGLMDGFKNYTASNIYVLDLQDQKLSFDLNQEDLDVLKNQKRFVFLNAEGEVAEDIFETGKAYIYSTVSSSEQASLEIDASVSYYRLKNADDYISDAIYKYPSMNGSNLMPLNTFLDKYALDEFTRKISASNTYNIDDLRTIFDYVNSTEFINTLTDLVNIDDLVIVSNSLPGFSNKYCIWQKINFPSHQDELMESVTETIYTNGENATGYHDKIHSELTYYNTDDTFYRFDEEFASSSTYYSVTYYSNSETDGFTTVPLREFLINNNMADLIKENYSQEDLEKITTYLNDQMNLTLKD